MFIIYEQPINMNGVHIKNRKEHFATLAERQNESENKLQFGISVMRCLSPN